MLAPERNREHSFRDQLSALNVVFMDPLQLNGGGIDGFFLENYDLLQSLLTRASIGAGAASDAWNKHLEAIKKTLEEIDQLHHSRCRGCRLRGARRGGWR